MTELNQTADSGRRDWRRLIITAGTLLVAVAAVAAAVLAYGLYGSEASIVVSPETTLITEPLAADGLPDYARHSLALAGRGTPPAANAAVPLLEAFWPMDLDDDDLVAVCADLGIERPDRPLVGFKGDNFFFDTPPPLQPLRSGSRGLVLRSMHRLGDGRFAEAWSDILAVHRLAPKADAGSLIGHLMATALSATACQATLRLLDAPGLPAEIVAAVGRNLESLPPLTAPRRSIVTERFGVLDFMIHVCQMPRDERAEVLSVLECRDPAVEQTFAMSLDCDRVLATTVADYARLDAALAHPSWAERQQALDQLGREATAAALADRRDGDAAGGYPERLDELVPRHLDRLPLDPFIDAPFRYERRAEGYFLSSVGQDGRHDRGTDLVQPIVGGEWVSEWMPPEQTTGTDLVIRLPLLPSPVLDRIRKAPVASP